jgi:tetratricopeptide (TPR) repeat protein
MTDDDLQQRLALDAAPGPALALSPADADALVAGALAGAGFGPPGGGGDTGPAAHGGGRGARSAARGGLASGTKLAIAALALAAVVVIAILALRHTPGTHAAAPIDAAIDAPRDEAGGSAGSAATGSAAAAGSAADAAVDIGSGVDTAPASGSDDTADDIDIDAAPVPAHPHKPRPPETRETADLLGEANAKRAAKQWRESDALYTRVVRRAPKSLAAQTALVASASLRLEHLGDPRGAATRFRRALAIAPSGALAEEARWGLAEAARALHDDTAEARALDDFLAHHAASPLAPRARARRSELP